MPWRFCDFMLPMPRPTQRRTHSAPVPSHRPVGRFGRPSSEEHRHRRGSRRHIGGERHANLIASTSSVLGCEAGSVVGVSSQFVRVLWTNLVFVVFANVMRLPPLSTFLAQLVDTTVVGRVIASR